MNRSWSNTPDETLMLLLAAEHNAMVEQDEAFCIALERAIAAGHERDLRKCSITVPATSPVQDLAAAPTASTTSGDPK